MNDILSQIDAAQRHQVHASGMWPNLLILSPSAAVRFKHHHNVLHNLVQPTNLDLPPTYAGMMILETRSLDSGFLVASHCQDIPK